MRLFCRVHKAIATTSVFMREVCRAEVQRFVRTLYFLTCRASLSRFRGNAIPPRQVCDLTKAFLVRLCLRPLPGHQTGCCTRCDRLHLDSILVFWGVVCKPWRQICRSFQVGLNPAPSIVFMASSPMLLKIPDDDHPLCYLFSGKPWLQGYRRDRYLRRLLICRE